MHIESSAIPVRHTRGLAKKLDFLETVVGNVSKFPSGCELESIYAVFNEKSSSTTFYFLINITFS
jgi:hypothetical protein